MSETQEHQERRQFSRILFNAECTISQDGMMWSTDVEDISLKGVLISKPEGFSMKDNKEFDASIKLAGDKQCINMKLVFSNEHNSALGFSCEHIDLESMAHLKRLVELNLADEGLLHRELSALSNSH